MANKIREKLSNIIYDKKLQSASNTKIILELVNFPPLNIDDICVKSTENVILYIVNKTHADHPNDPVDE